MYARATTTRRSFARLAVAAAVLPALATRVPPAVARADGPPNIVLILTDDLDVGSVSAMPQVQQVLAKQGTSFATFLATTPLCCPSRASILRGQYAHNHGVLGNTGPDGGYATFSARDDEESTVATWLHDAGYRTALFGKYLNGYPTRRDSLHVPPGWDEWAAAVDHETYAELDYDLNENGTIVHYGHDPADYLTDVLSAKATSFVKDAAGGGQPFFLYLATFAPHAPSTPAPRDAEAFANAQAPRPPSFNEPDVSDKPAWVRDRRPLFPNQIARLDQRYRERLRSLLAVDDLVAALVGALQAAGALDRTYIFFASDNGYQMGEHRLPFGKQSPYDEAVRVPLIVRGPGVPAGQVVDQVALNIDLSPTFADWAGATVPDFVDGRSLAPLLQGEPPAAGRQAALVELFGRDKPKRTGPAMPQATPDAASESEDDEAEAGAPWTATPPFRALRTSRYLYVEYDTGERELYDLKADPYELDNLAATADPNLIAALAARLAALRDCAGADCRTIEDAPLALPDGSV